MNIYFRIHVNMAVISYKFISILSLFSPYKSALDCCNNIFTYMFRNIILLKSENGS